MRTVESVISKTNLGWGGIIGRGGWFKWSLYVKGQQCWYEGWRPVIGAVNDDFMREFRAPSTRILNGVSKVFFKEEGAQVAC